MFYEFIHADRMSVNHLFITGKRVKIHLYKTRRLSDGCTKQFGWTYLAQANLAGHIWKYIATSEIAREYILKQ